jgi:Transposase IS66 family
MRRHFYEFYDSTKSPLSANVLARIRELYAIETEIRGHPAEYRRQMRQERSRPIVEALHAWLQDHLGRVSAISDLAKTMRYTLRHWSGLMVFLDDGRVEMDTNVVERAIRPNTLTRKNALFGLGRRCPSLGDRNDADPDSEAEWRRSDGMAHRCPATHRVGPHKIPRTAYPAAVELDPAQPANGHGTGGLAADDKSPQPVKSNLPRRRRDLREKCRTAIRIGGFIGRGPHNVRRRYDGERIRR